MAEETQGLSIVAAEPLAVTIETGGGLQTFTEDDVRRFIVGDKPVSDAAIRQYLLRCKSMGADPLTDVQARIDGNGTLTPMMTIGAYERRAQRNAKYQGHEAGVVVIDPEGQLVRRAGCAVYNGEFLMGGWARVFVEGYANPVYDEVSVEEYSTGQGNWKKMPGTMIRKVALSHALREAFPQDLCGSYTAEEMGE